MHNPRTIFGSQINLIQARSPIRFRDRIAIDHPGNDGLSDPLGRFPSSARLTRCQSPPAFYETSRSDRFRAIQLGTRSVVRNNARRSAPNVPEAPTSGFLPVAPATDPRR